MRLRISFMQLYIYTGQRVLLGWKMGYGSRLFGLYYHLHMYLYWALCPTHYTPAWEWLHGAVWTMASTFAWKIAGVGLVTLMIKSGFFITSDLYLCLL
jgi:hypothetical protein